MIRIINLRSYTLGRNEVLYRVDRKSAIGNPFYMKDESYRNEVCDKYEKWFNKKIEENDEEIMKILSEIKFISRTKDVALACWCAPKRCHAETILKYLKNTI